MPAAAGHDQLPTTDESSVSTNTSPELFNTPFSVDPTQHELSTQTTNDLLAAWWNTDSALLQFDSPDLQLPDSYPAFFSPSQSQSLYNSPKTNTTGSPRAPDYLSPSDASLHAQPLALMTPGQASLFQSLFSLSGSTSSTLVPTATATTNARSSALLASPWSISQPDPEEPQPVDDDDEDEGVKQIICGTLALDMNAEGNALPFVLESYAAWVTRTAFEPRKAARGTRDLVLKSFNDSDDSRWTITMLANVVRALATSTTWADSWESCYQPTVLVLQERVLQSISRVGMRSGPPEQETKAAIKVLENTMEIVAIHYTTGLLLYALQLMQTAAPLFRRICPEPSDRSIHLQLLLLQPVFSLRHYAIVDIFSSVTLERPMFFQYDTSYDPNVSPQVIHFQGEVGLQWLHGIPGLIVLVFARINVLREQGIHDIQAVSEVEQMLKSFVPIPSLSSDSSLIVARLMVQECWRQVAYIYLYMGLCGANADDPRVTKPLGRFMKLLDGTKPGHVPDAFLALTLAIAGVAARRDTDRRTIRQRTINSERFKYPGTNGSEALLFLEYLWLRSDGESRPATDRKSVV